MTDGSGIMFMVSTHLSLLEDSVELLSPKLGAWGLRGFAQH